jgi:hypothetical protein
MNVTDFETDTVLPLQTPQNILTQPIADFTINTRQFIKPENYKTTQIIQQKHFPVTDICDSFLVTFNQLFNNNTFDRSIFYDQITLYNFSIIIIFFYICIFFSIQ